MFRGMIFTLARAQTILWFANCDFVVDCQRGYSGICDSFRPLISPTDFSFKVDDFNKDLSIYSVLATIGNLDALRSVFF